MERNVKRHVVRDHKVHDSQRHRARRTGYTVHEAAAANAFNPLKKICCDLEAGHDRRVRCVHQWNLVIDERVRVIIRQLLARVQHVCYANALEPPAVHRVFSAP
mmetsp:Transcript_5201/g.14678  ORF Transcript_5201/g.14678 Transcript_5201/m.14678 type:complete len:104 (+) Transcript_5201:693-1004(+)